MAYVGCDIEALREHIERHFRKGMTWDNQGKWHIDHRKPCASFDLTKEPERDMCFHYTNLQPMWGPDNLSKGNSYDPNTFCWVWVSSFRGWVKVTQVPYT